MMNTEKDSVCLWVEGEPRPQSRARVTRNGVYSSAGRPLKMWRASVLAELARGYPASKFTPLAGALEVELIFKMPTTDKKRWGSFSYVKPDFDNLAKAVLDVMEDHGLFATGDGQVARAIVCKVWCPRAEAGCRITLRQIPNLADQPNLAPDWLRK